MHLQKFQKFWVAKTNQVTLAYLLGFSTFTITELIGGEIQIKYTVINSHRVIVSETT